MSETHQLIPAPKAAQLELEGARSVLLVHSGHFGLVTGENEDTMNQDESTVKRKNKEKKLV